MATAKTMTRGVSLSIAQLKECFGVSHVTIFNWVKELAFPEVHHRTPGNLKRWARTNHKLMVRDPSDVLLGRRNKRADKALKRNAAGKLSGAKSSSRVPAVRKNISASKATAKKLSRTRSTAKKDSLKRAVAA
jgi:hypothetical protein